MTKTNAKFVHRLRDSDLEVRLRKPSDSCGIAHILIGSHRTACVLKRLLRVVHDGQPLAKLLDQNPIHPAFQLMELYRKHDVRRYCLCRTHLPIICAMVEETVPPLQPPVIDAESSGFFNGSAWLCA